MQRAAVPTRFQARKVLHQQTVGTTDQCGTWRHAKLDAVFCPHMSTQAVWHGTTTAGLSRRSSVSCAAMTTHEPLPAVVTVDWLNDRLSEVKLLDTSWYLPPMGRDARQEFAAARIPGAQFWDIDGVCDASTDLPHMLPSEAAFAAAADALGISNEDAVVVYDGMGVFAAPRAWWAWRVFGHSRVAVLEGGLPAWKAAGKALDESAASNDTLAAATAAARAASSGSSTKYKATLMKDKVLVLEEMQRLMQPAAAAVAAGQPAPDLHRQVVDARPAGRFAGVDPEPRPGLPSGHMPGAKNVPFMQVYEGGVVQGARMKPVDELEALFRGGGVDVQAPLVCSCGSGLTACVLALAIYQVTGQLAPVYDGSWSEWAAVPGAPIARDEAAGR
ncbi:mercaptopyruvate sulfurtransferase-like protein [Scenedesmus sp. NREL 46B-D3]|nr:mercaptopyruvate sulfurtransferase-like protein [Scenedesmus sp. NREL 46B-D3]